MKRLKRMSFTNTHSVFLSAAGRAASITQRTIAPFVQRMGKTITRKPTFDADKAVWQQQQRMSLEETRARDEQDMFDAQMMNVPSRQLTHQQRDREVSEQGESA